MLNMLKADLAKEMQSATVDEEDAQAEYAKMMADSAEKRRVDSQSLADKESAKADLESKALKLNEEDAQAEYEKMMADSAEKRRVDSESLADKEGTKADLESKALKLKEEETATMK